MSYLFYFMCLFYFILNLTHFNWLKMFYSCKAPWSFVLKGAASIKICIIIITITMSSFYCPTPVRALWVCLSIIVYATTGTISVEKQKSWVPFCLEETGIEWYNECKKVSVCVCVCVLRRVLRHSVSEGGQVLYILVVKPLDLEVQVHVVSCLAEPMLLMFCKKPHTQKYTHQIHLMRCVGAVTGLQWNFVCMFVCTHESSTFYSSSDPVFIKL